MPDLLTVDEVAAQLGLSERTIRRLMASGEITYRRIANRTRFLQADVDEYLERSRVPAQPAGGGAVIAPHRRDRVSVPDRRAG